MHQPLDNSSTVEQDAGIVAWSLPTPHPPLTPTLVIQHSSWLTHLGNPLGNGFLCLCVHLGLGSVWGTVDTGQSLDTLGVCRLIGLHAICTDDLLALNAA